MGTVGYYIVKLLVQHEGFMGAPVLHLDLGVNAVTGQVMGSAQITQALPPPYGNTVIPTVTGAILHTGFGEDTLLVHLTGDYVVSVPPPAIGSYLAHFSAALAVSKDWNGRGSFSYAHQVITGCTVENVSET
ncbi:DUF1842 domain-containing protein [Sphingomonas ginsenosidivorax]|uniref:DUF1842 domain-containing protein n=1 Tax=Sphingomonas ginsenosidivorax TaxID=862135 RepID=UPI001F5576B8|nr:DUF1842 domain-containing protein [Sphingomonas ginsenosidivorax]